MANEAASAGSRASSQASSASGAQMQIRYLQRKQEFVSVNRTDLEDIKEFDASSQGFSSFGVFLVGGGAWLGVEKAYESWNSTEGFTFLPIMGVCILACVVGCFLWYQGFKMAIRKTSRIQRIFDETEDYRPQNQITHVKGGSSQQDARAIHNRT